MNTTMSFTDTTVEEISTNMFVYSVIINTVQEPIRQYIVMDDVRIVRIRSADSNNRLRRLILSSSRMTTQVIIQLTTRRIADSTSYNEVYDTIVALMEEFAENDEFDNTLQRQIAAYHINSNITFAHLDSFDGFQTVIDSRTHHVRKMTPAEAFNKYGIWAIVTIAVVFVAYLIVVVYVVWKKTQHRALHGLEVVDLDK